MNGDPAAMVAVFRSRFGRLAREHALVLEAVGIPHATAQMGGEHVVAVPGELAERAARELAQYEHENRGWRRPEELPLALSEGWPAVVAWTLGLVLVDALANSRGFGVDWLAAGASDAALVRAGELWRTATALTLHADFVHLASNIVFGALFVALVCELLGNGLALLAIVGAGALGNLANAWIRNPEFSSIGASTAVFAALGIVGAHRWQRRKLVRSRGVASWVPLVASAFLLAYLGAGARQDDWGPDAAGGRSIDVGGHVCGFLVGALLGAVLGRFVDKRPVSTAAQVGFGFAALALLAGAWLAAFAR
jgi:membrane associated rhomboid family serine protease